MSRKTARKPQALKRTSGRAQKMGTMVPMDIAALERDGYNVRGLRDSQDARTVRVNIDRAW